MVLFFLALQDVQNIYAHQKDFTIVHLSENALKISHNGGATFENFSQGLPKTFLPLRIMVDDQQTLYLSTYSSGLFRRRKNDAAWCSITPPNAFERCIYSEFPMRFRKISAFAVHPTNVQALAVAVKHAMYISRDGGNSWSEFVIPSQWRKHYFTSLAFTPNDELFVGTSFGGVFVIRKNAMKHFSTGLPFETYSATLNFYEECGALALHDAQTVTVGLNNVGALYVLNRSSSRWEHKATIPTRCEIHDIRYHAGNFYISANGFVYRIDGDAKIYSIEPLNDLIKKISNDTTIGLFIVGHFKNFPPLFVRVRHHFDARLQTIDTALAQTKALYVNPHVARKSIDRIIEIAQKCGFNALVIDMKDDFGALYFPTENVVAKTIGACKQPLNVNAILSKLHTKKMRVIARLVVFKDKYLYRAYGGAYAVADVGGGSWVGNPAEFWLDPYSEFVHTYVVDLASELEKIGFDEIQFDYIRFPTDGPIERCYFRHQKESAMFKSEAILSLLKRAKKRISIPLSVDVYGFTAWYNFGNRIGQDFEAMAEYVDVLCPMVYPSHFGTVLYRNKATKADLPGLLVKESIIRGKMFVGEIALIRPYLQAFNFLSPTWGPQYILTQIRAAEEAKASGFTFWNAKGDYEMVHRALKNK